MPKPDPGPHVCSLKRQAAINPYVRSVSPALRWQQRTDGWIALGFEVADGAYVDFAPDSADLSAVADTVAAIGALPCSDIPADWAE